MVENMNIQDIEKLAVLARLGLTDSEKEKMTTDFESILGYIDQLNSVDTSTATPWNGMVTNHTKSDEAVSASSNTHDIIMQDMPDTVDGFLKVPKIL
jgi:aspartyl-tRNA(Asn)/glutamyl-tRNA(Gln) amidotransferase subunit C